MTTWKPIQGNRRGSVIYYWFAEFLSMKRPYLVRISPTEIKLIPFPFCVEYGIHVTRLRQKLDLGKEVGLWEYDWKKFSKELTIKLTYLENWLEGYNAQRTGNDGEGP